MASTRTADRLIPAGLILLSAVPAVAGAARLAELGGGAQVTPDNARFFAAPIPVVVHIVGATVFCTLGAFQFSPGLRRRRRGWHRVAGRVVIPCGLAAALSGLWMTLFYPLPDSDGDLLAAMRIVFGTTMVASLVLGFTAIRRRDITRHRAWVVRGYAIGQGAGTQVLTNVPWLLLVGVPGQFARALLMGAGWVINIAFAEWVIRRSRVRAAHPAGTASPAPVAGRPA